MNLKRDVPNEKMLRNIVYFCMFNVTYRRAGATATVTARHNKSEINFKPII